MSAGSARARGRTTAAGPRAITAGPSAPSPIPGRAATATTQLALELPAELPALGIEPEWKVQPRLWGPPSTRCARTSRASRRAWHSRVHRPLQPPGRRRPGPVLRARARRRCRRRGGTHRRRQRPQPVRAPADGGQAGACRARRGAPRGWRAPPGVGMRTARVGRPRGAPSEPPGPPGARVPRRAPARRRAHHGRSRTRSRSRSTRGPSASCCSCAARCASTTGWTASWPARCPGSCTARPRPTSPR
jgi:hypothetical protein